VIGCFGIGFNCVIYTGSQTERCENDGDVMVMTCVCKSVVIPKPRSTELK
jgi:copper(I)-binding protein